MYLYVIALLIVNVSPHANCFYPKCCGTGEYLAKENSSYRCIERKLNRMYVATNGSDFLKNNYNGECVDVSTGFFIFKIAEGKIIQKEPVINELAFPKCCPLNHTYNTALKACRDSVKGFNITVTGTNLIKVGLPNCKVIADYEVNEINSLFKKLTQSATAGTYCFDWNEKGSYIYRECNNELDVCDNIKCVKKCCPDGQSFINQSKCFDTYTRGLNLSTFSDVDKSEDPYAVVSNRVCPSIYRLQKERYAYHLDENGTFELWHNKSKSFIAYEVSDLNSYCIEHAQTPSFSGYYFFMCFAENPPAKKFEYTLWPKILSSIFLVLTVLVYIILHETRNMFGKLLVNYCFAVFFDNVLLTYAQMDLHPSHINCVLRGFGIIFFASAEFSWSNAVCYNIYRTIGSMQQTTGPLRVDNNYSQAFFFNFPHLIMELVNTIFFIKTAVYCLKVKNEITKIKDTISDEKNRRFQRGMERLFLILKLSVIMGISFMFEVISGFFEMKEMGTTAMYVEIILDTIYCLQGNDQTVFDTICQDRKRYNDAWREG
ncbi:hypothetical protein NQ315_003417 [Exocentrus adspersus]|uniref:Uncharacterized protein n=1 Tax=Exocentrus adspersus TaxID=1586481 RepID=A0AAV8VMT8_9CUCU|nr:hypothetical protein NQ315_003417 [Exocentrus adspersus]